MPLPHALGRFNQRVTNRVLGPILTRLPGFGTVVHTGRRSGRTYRTPMLAFRRDDRLTFALTYGPDADWVRNVLAAGTGTLETGDRRLVLSEPRLLRDPERRAVPGPVRLALRVMRVSDFLEARVKTEERRLSAPP